MTWLESWVGVLLGLVLAARFGRDALREAAAPAFGPATDALSTPRTKRDRVPTWLLVTLVLLTLGPRVFELLT